MQCVGSFVFLASLSLAQSFIRPKIFLHIEATAEDASEKWRTTERELKKAVDSVFISLLPYVVRTSSQVQLSSECQGDLLRLVLGIKNLKLWALQVLDATGKPSGGLLKKSVTELGSYDECLSVKVPDDAFVGQYCLLDIQPPLPPVPKDGKPITSNWRLLGLSNFTAQTEVMEELANWAYGFYVASVTLGICLPSTCKRDDLQILADLVFQKIEWYSDVISCETKEVLQVDTLQKILLVIIALFIFTILLCTVVEMWASDWILESNPCKYLLKAISLRCNYWKFLSTIPPTDQTLSCLSGMRSLTMIWIVLAHTIFVNTSRTLRNYGEYSHYVRTVPFQIISNGYPSVDTFLFITGVLIAYSVVGKFDKSGMKSFNIPVIIIRRIWRLLPSAMLMVALTILLPLVGSGPFWKIGTNTVADDCRRSWWTIPAFINNFYEFDTVCLPHFWYISVDMQILPVALVYFFILFRNSKLANVFGLLVMIGSVISTAVITYLHQLPPTLFLIYPDLEFVRKYMLEVYRAAYPRISGYFVGLVLGTKLARNKDNKKMSKIVQLIGWGLSAACNLSIIYTPHLATLGRDPTTLESVLYASLQHLGWALGLAWVTFSCASGQAGLVNGFLSWRGFLVLTRISYLAYLIQIPIMYYFWNSLRTALDGTPVIMVWLFFGFLVVTSALSTVVRLLFEAPLMNLEDLFWKRLSQQPPSKISDVLKPEIFNNETSNGAFINSSIMNQFSPVVPILTRRRSALSVKM